jgi:WD40 repeat protein
VARGEPIGEPLPHPDLISYVAFSPDGNTLLTAGKDHVARLWEKGSGRLLHQCQVGDFSGQAAFSPDGRTFLTAAWDGSVREWETATGKNLGIRLPPTAATSSTILAAGGRIALRADQAGPGGQVWDLGSGKGLHTWPRCWEGDAAVISPDGSSVLTASGGYIQIRETATGRPRGAALPHNTSLLVPQSRSWSPDGRTVATGGWDQAARLWDATTCKSLGAPLLHPTPPLTAFAPDGQQLATCAGADVYLWPVPAPLAGEPERIRQQVEVLTGMEIDARGDIQELEPDILEQSHQRLRRSGGPPGTTDHIGGGT